MSTMTMSLVEEHPMPTITIKTLFKGEVQVSEEELITFTSPLLGFDHLRRFYIYQTSPGSLFWMQSIEDESISFCVLAPFQAGLDPNFEITGEDIADIGARSTDDVLVLTVVVLDQDPSKSRTNLRAPLLVGKSSRLAKQVILQDQSLPLRFPLRDVHSLKASGH